MISVPLINAFYCIHIYETSGANVIKLNIKEYKESGT